MIAHVWKDILMMEMINARNAIILVNRVINSPQIVPFAKAAINEP